MAKNAITTHELSGTRVIGGKNGKKRIGKVRSFVFHPHGKRVVGFIVKRPDLLWMFRRKDVFVSIDGYDLIDGRVVIRPDPDATNKAACKSLGVAWDDCVLWVGMPMMTEDGTTLGTVGNVTFNQVTGAVNSVEVDTGMAASALLGRRELPADLILGFRRGVGVELTQTGEAEEGLAVTDSRLGAILVSDEAKEMAVEGGIAEAAGQATAVVADKAGKAAKKTGDAVNKGAHKIGEQIGKTKDAIGDMKEEYRKERGPKKTSEQKTIQKSDEAQAGTGETSSKKTASSKTTSSQSKTTPSKSKSASSKEKPGSGNAARAVGEHLRKSKGMFSAFKEEYDKARSDEDRSSRKEDE